MNEDRQLIDDTLKQAQLITHIESILQLNKKLLSDAPLTPQQRADLNEVHKAAERFCEIINSQAQRSYQHWEPDELQHVRHDLRNHSNVMLGYTRIIVRDLPDNLLLHMQYVRKIHETAALMLGQVEQIR